MTLQYTVIDPTKNITLLVTTPMPRARYAQIASHLLALEKDAEQVGFLESSDEQDAALRMMGGEFCGNAAMSLGAWLCRGETEGVDRHLTLDVSGVDSPVSCDISVVRHGYIGTVSMPLPEKIETLTLPFGDGEVTLDAVFLPGICHIIAPNGTVQRHQAEDALRQWAGLLQLDAVGLLLFDETAMYFDPLVYVRATDTAVWERGCGSGSAAIGAWMTKKHGKGQCLSLKQPGGAIAVATVWQDGAVTSLTITGTVALGKEKSVEITW